jgi:hypothetical protein
MFCVRSLRGVGQHTSRVAYRVSALDQPGSHAAFFRRSAVRRSVDLHAVGMAAEEWGRVLEFWFHQGDMRESFKHKWFPSGADNMQVRHTHP